MKVLKVHKLLGALNPSITCVNSVQFKVDFRAHSRVELDLYHRI